MKNITFKQQITVPENLVQGLAVELGWTPTLTRQIEVVDDETTDPATTHFEDEVYENPISYTDFIDQKSKEHTVNFFKPFGDKLVELELAKLGIDEQKQQAKEQIEVQVIAPIIEALTSSVETSE